MANGNGEYLTIKQLQETLLPYSRATIHKFLRDNKITAVKKGPKQRKYSKKEVEAIVEKSKEDIKTWYER